MLVSMVYRRAHQAVTTVSAATHEGLFEQENDDTFLVLDLIGDARYGPVPHDESYFARSRLVLGVFDGTGVITPGGRLASRTAAESICRQFGETPPNIGQDELHRHLIKSFEMADTEVFYLSARDQRAREAITTATIAAVTHYAIELAHIGDSRAYLLRRYRLSQLTRDDSLVNRFVEGGRLSIEEVQPLIDSNFITQALGTPSQVRPFSYPTDLCRQDMLLLCTRGLSSSVEHGALRQLLLENPEPHDACRALIKSALEGGCKENITAVVVRFDGPWLPAPTDADVLEDENVFRRAVLNRDRRRRRGIFRYFPPLNRWFTGLKGT